MRYILLSEEKKWMGFDDNNNDFWFGTKELVQLIARHGKIFNMGTNVLYAEKVINACDDKEVKNFISVEDSWYDILIKDLETFNFREFKLVGVSYCRDVENIKDAKKEKPKTEEIKFKLIGKPESLKEKEDLVKTKG